MQVLRVLQTWSSCSADFSKARCIDCTPDSMLSSEISPSPFFSNWRKIERIRASVGSRPSKKRRASWVTSS